MGAFLCFFLYSKVQFFVDFFVLEEKYAWEKWMWEEWQCVGERAWETRLTRKIKARQSLGHWQHNRYLATG